MCCTVECLLLINYYFLRGLLVGPKLSFNGMQTMRDCAEGELRDLKK